MGHALKFGCAAPLHFDVGRQFRQHAVISLAGGRRQEDANHQIEVLLPRRLPGPYKCARLQYELPNRRARVASACPGLSLSQQLISSAPCKAMDSIHSHKIDVSRGFEAQGTRC